MNKLKNQYYGLMAMLALSPLGAFAASSGANIWSKTKSMENEIGPAMGLVFNICLLIGVLSVGYGIWQAIEKYRSPNGQQIKGSGIAISIIGGGALMSLKGFSGDIMSLFESDSTGPARQQVTW